jgi:hypothetical protein
MVNEDRCQPHGTNVVGPDYTAMCPFDLWVEMTDAIQDEAVEFAISFHWVSRAMARQQPGMSNPYMLQSEPKFNSLHLLDADKVCVELFVTCKSCGNQEGTAVGCGRVVAMTEDNREG